MVVTVVLFLLQLLESLMPSQAVSINQIMEEVQSTDLCRYLLQFRTLLYRGVTRCSSRAPERGGAGSKGHPCSFKIQRDRSHFSA